MTHKAWLFLALFEVNSGFASAENYVWEDQQHVCAIEHSSFFKADGSGRGEWKRWSIGDTIFITFAECTITEEDAKKLHDMRYDSCQVSRMEHGDYSGANYQGMYVRGFTRDLWYARNEAWFPDEEAKAYQVSKISSDGRASGFISIDGKFRYVTIERSAADEEWAYWTVEAQCAPVFAPDLTK